MVDVLVALVLMAVTTFIVLAGWRWISGTWVPPMFWPDPPHNDGTSHAD